MTTDPAAPPTSRRVFLTGLAGTAGAQVLAPTARAQEDEENDEPNDDEADPNDDEETPEEDETEPDDDDEPAETNDIVTVELVDYAFEPGTDQPLTIEPGTTVQFVWITDTHNIVLLEQPDESDWGGVEAIEDAGFEHEHTFEVEGTYEFVCVPHEALGMFGTIEVVADVDAPGEPVGPQVPEEAMTLAIGTTFALVATLGFAYVFLKYGSGGPNGGG